MNMALLPVLVVLVLSGYAQCKSIIEYLPGYPGKLPFKLETGYVGVGDLEEKQLFYYFIESERSPAEDPLLLWLTGGPGCSALSALVYEIGPLKFNNPNSSHSASLPTFSYNPFSWTKIANIIFVDEPIGTGFSYATSAEAYNIGDTVAVEDLYVFIRKWLNQHTEFLANPLYVGGDSYSGIIVPQVTYKVSEGNSGGIRPRMNLMGYVLGNPFTDPTDYNAEVEYAYRVGLLSDELYTSAKTSCHGWYVNPRNEECAQHLKAISDCTSKIYIMHVLEPYCASWLRNKTDKLSWHRRSLFKDFAPPQGPTHWCRTFNYVSSYIWANNEAAQAALHVRSGTIESWARCNKTLQGIYDHDVFSSLVYHKKLSESNKAYRALIYSGDQDMLVPYLGTQKWIKTLNLTLTNVWEPWFVDGQVAGYTQKYAYKGYELTFATLKGAGHTAPEYKPKEGLAMVDRWFSYYPL